MPWSQQTAGADTWLCWRWLLTSFRDISRVHKPVFHSALHSSAANQRLHIWKSCPALPGGAGTGVHYVWPEIIALQACGGWECVHGQCSELVLPPAIFQKSGALRTHSLPTLGTSQRSGQRQRSRAAREGCTCSVVTHTAVLKVHHCLYT